MTNLSLHIFAAIPDCLLGHTGYSYPSPTVKLSLPPLTPTIATTFSEGSSLKYASIGQSAAALAVTPGYEYISRGPVIKQQSIIATPAITKTYLPPPTAAFGYTAPLSKIATYTPTSNIVSIPSVNKVAVSAYDYPRIAIGAPAVTKVVSSPAISTAYAAGPAFSQFSVSPTIASRVAYTSPFVKTYATSPSVATYTSNLGYSTQKILSAPAVANVISSPAVATYASSPAISQYSVSPTLVPPSYVSSPGRVAIGSTLGITGGYIAPAAKVAYSSPAVSHLSVSPAVSSSYISAGRLAYSSPVLGSTYGLSGIAPAVRKIAAAPAISSTYGVVSPSVATYSSAPAVSTSYVSTPIKQVSYASQPLLTRYAAAPAISTLGAGGISATRYVSSPGITTHLTAPAITAQYTSQPLAYTSSAGLAQSYLATSPKIVSPSYASPISQYAASYAASPAPVVTSYASSPAIAAYSTGLGAKQISVTGNPLLTGSYLTGGLGSGIIGTQPGIAVSSGLHASSLG